MGYFRKIRKFVAMEQYIVSARKYRPSTFATVVGQSALTSTLKNAIASDRLAHAYLFCGSRGVGKTSCARIFAKTINCTNPTADGEACNECDSCKAFNEGNSLNIVELDAASHNGIEDMKALIEQVQVPPTRGRYRVFIIDEVHMLSTAAFNAFLKTLEEPPHYVIFILATTEKHKIIPTILSRCQIYDFNRITIKDMVSHLGNVAGKEGIEAEPAALSVIARQADGAMRDALSIFDQVAASTRGHVTYDATIASLNVLDSSYYSRLVEAFEKQDVPAALLIFHEIRRKGFDAQFFINGLGQYIRDLMLASNPSTLPLLDVPDDTRDAMAAQAARLKPEFIYEAMGLCNDADLNYRTSSNKQLLVELTLIRIAQLLSPSPIKRGRAGGPIKPIKPVNRQATSEAPASVAASPASTYTRSAAAEPPKPAEQAPARPAAPAAVRPHPVARPGTGSPQAMRAGGISMHRRDTAAEAAAAIGATHRDTPVTAKGVKKAWLDFGNAHSAEPALSNLIKKVAPRHSEGNRWEVEVDSQVTANLLTDHLEELMPYLRDRLANDDFTLGITVSSAGLGPEFWSDSQVLQHLMQNKTFADFYKKFHLTLH